MTPSWWGPMTSSLAFQASTRKHIGRFLLPTLGRTVKCVFGSHLDGRSKRTKITRFHQNMLRVDGALAYQWMCSSVGMVWTSSNWMFL